MRSTSIWHALVGFVIVFCSTCVVAALVICSKCGYESQPGNKFCSHCGADLGQAGSAGDSSGKTQDAAVVKTGPVKAASIDPEVVAAELKASEEFLGKGYGWVGLFFCENAMALNMLATNDVSEADRILLLHQKCEKGVRHSVKPCPYCGGSGSLQKTIEVASLDGGVSSKKAGKGVCPACRGMGIVAGRAGLSAVEAVYGTSLGKYTVLRQGARWIPVGSAWIPPELDGKLNAKQIATMKRVSGARCPACLGFGQITCEKCGGVGKAKCPNNACSGGIVSKKLEKGLTTSPRELHVRCSVCDGLSFVRCSACSGGGSLACKTCNGTGKLPVCKRCDGGGVNVCSKCKGSGAVKDATCDTCGGCGAVLCTVCTGDGRKKK